MGEKTVPLHLSYMDELLQAIDDRLFSQEVPTVLRIRAGMLAEEVFRAAETAQRAGGGVIRCVFPEPLAVVLQYKEDSAPLEPDFSAVQALNDHACTYGVEASFTRGTCKLEIGKKKE